MAASMPAFEQHTVVHTEGGAIIQVTGYKNSPNKGTRWEPTKAHGVESTETCKCQS